MPSIVRAKQGGRLRNPTKPHRSLNGRYSPGIGAGPRILVLIGNTAMFPMSWTLASLLNKEW
jgi:hypothetical protein